ncbi:MAG TPA: WD40 repeat domain-containing protein, partial [Blastocatellia bacterium]|nr:WD40 repeat domain-containing protein [Blastocatellia bacterium]
IRRYSDMPIGEREKELLGKSLRWDLGKAGALVCSFLIAAIALAAPLSVREGWDGGVRLSDGHRRAVRQVVFSPDGRLVVSVGEDAKAIVWDFARRKPLATLTDQTDWITSVAFSPDGKYFATGSQDNTIVVWDATSIEKAHVFRVAGAVVGVAFSPDAQLLAAGSTVPDPAVTVWRVGQWLKVWQRPLGGQIGAPWNSLFSPDSRWILASDGRGAAVTWDVASGDLIDQDDNGWTGYKALSPDGKQIVSAGGKVRFWDSSRYWKRKEKRLLTSQLAHDDFGRAAAFSPDGRFAATGAEDTILWDATTHEVITHFTYPAIVWGLAFSPDGRSLISSHADGSILIWDVRQRKLVGNLNGHVGGVRAVAFSADGRHIASAGDDHSVIIWGAETGKKEQTLLKHTARINAVAFSPDGRSIISGDQSDSVLMWDVTGDRGYPRWTATSGSDYCMAMSPDGRWAADSSGVWATADGHRVVNFAVAGLGGMYGAAFSSDGHMLTCVAPAPNAISLWDTESWRVIARLDTASGPLITVSLSPDGKWLVTGDDDGVVRLWSVRPLREEAIIGRHGSRLKSVVFSHDGTLIASAGDDKTIALWDFQSRKLITRIGTHASRVLSVAFSPDDKQLVSGEEDGSVNVFTRRRTLWGHRLD